MKATAKSPSAIIHTLSASEQQMATKVYMECFGLKRGEAVLIVTDANKYAGEAAVFFEGAKGYTKNFALWLVAGMQTTGEEPPETLVEAMKRADVAIFVTTYSLSHTKARIAACQNGTRIASLPGITLDMMKRTLDIDYSVLSSLSSHLANILTKGKNIRVTSRVGTDVTFSINKRKGIADTGDLTQAGSFGNLPAGEAFIAPQEGTAEGTIVIDGAFANIDLDEPIKVRLKKGKIVTIDGRNAGWKLKSKLAVLPPQASWVCEFGIGTNPKAQLSPLILEAEKVFGTCHIAFGRNITFDGTIDVPYHGDGLIWKPTITVDNRIILKDEKFLV